MPSSRAQRPFKNLPLWAAFTVVALLFVTAAWAQGGSAGKVAAPTLTTGPRVWLGIDELQQNGFSPLQGKRVGLLTHPAGVNRNGVSTIEILRHAPGVNLVALYGPEHGIYGDEAADTPISDRIDQKTGLPVYSLYGKYRRPPPEMLKGIDVMVVDLQDLGTRSYTFISCVREVMGACFEQGKTVVILDRPDPVGGLKVGGPIVEEQWMSYVSDYQIPYVYGLTIGELARMAKGTPGWLKDSYGNPLSAAVLKAGKLIVMPMRGWTRSMLWQDTGLRWVPTSPKIINVGAAYGYGLTGLGGIIGQFSHGVGSPYPFRLLNFPGKTPEELAAVMAGLHLGGLTFAPKYYKEDGVVKSGVYVYITDWSKVVPTELSFYMMKYAAAWDPHGNPFARAKGTEGDLFNKHVGSTAWWDEIRRNGGKANVAGFFQKWNADDLKFQNASRQWWLYK